MKVFRVKTTDFVNLKKVESITDQKTLDLIDFVQNIVQDKIIKNLNKGKNSILMIGQSGNYYITARPCYIESLRSILESVGIENDKIIILQKQSQVQDLSLDQVKTLLNQ